MTERTISGTNPAPVLMSAVLAVGVMPEARSGGGLSRKLVIQDGVPGALAPKPIIHSRIRHANLLSNSASGDLVRGCGLAEPPDNHVPLLDRLLALLRSRLATKVGISGIPAHETAPEREHSVYRLPHPVEHQGAIRSKKIQA